AVSIDAPAAGDALGEVVVPAPLIHGYAQTVSLVASTAPGVGGEVVSYKLARSLPAATNPGATIELAATQPPLAGGLSDFKVTLRNAGRAEADFVLVRDGGDEPGDFNIAIYDEDGAQVAGEYFDTLISGLTF